MHNACIRSEGGETQDTPPSPIGLSQLLSKASWDFGPKMERTSFRHFALGPGPSRTERERERERACGNIWEPPQNNYMKISDHTPGGVMEQVMIADKRHRYMPEISGELFSRFQLMITCSITCQKFLGI